MRKHQLDLFSTAISQLYPQSTDSHIAPSSVTFNAVINYLCFPMRTKEYRAVLICRWPTWTALHLGFFIIGDSPLMS